MTIRVDLHVHTSASHDCRTEPKALLAGCDRVGLDRVCVTDHNTIAGALRLREMAPETVVVGQEITTSEGELIGLFLEREVPALLPPEETVALIEDQGGLVYLEHPYDLNRRRLSEEAVERLADRIHVVEVFNPRCDDVANRRAADLCEALGAAPGAGSDAHHERQLGSAFVEMEDFRDPGDFLEKLRAGRVVSHSNRQLMRLMALLRRS